jgi:hypothetical protein
MASELASAVGAAVRDVLVVAMIDRLVVSPPRAPRTPMTRSGDWREDDRERWDHPRDPWSVDDYEAPGGRTVNSYDRDDFESSTLPAVPTSVAIAVGVNVGRWWLARKGTVTAAVGVGVLATALGLAGGPIARAAVAVIAAATDVLTAESALSRINPS